jgi:hypothetical protein
MNLNTNNTLFDQILYLNKTIFLLTNEIVKKDNIIKLSQNDINTKNSIIYDIKRNNELLDDLNKTMLSNLNNKNKINQILINDLTSAKNEIKVLKTKKIEYIAKIEKNNNDFKEKIEQLEKKCDEMKKIMNEKDTYLNECIDALFMYEMKYDKL